LLTGGEAPVFIPTKGKRARVIDIAPETVDLLRTHKADQARIPPSRSRAGGRQRVARGRAPAWRAAARDQQHRGKGIRDADRSREVPEITVHGLRHTCASLLLAAGVTSKVVQERLAHRKIETTLNTYAHVLPGQQRAAAPLLASVLHRS